LFATGESAVAMKQSNYSFNEKKRIRKSFAKTKSDLGTFQEQNLLATQYESYRQFLQINIDPDKRMNVGLQKVFKDVFPITSNNGLIQLDFVSYRLVPPVYSEREALIRGMSYVGKIHVKFRMTIFEKDDRKNIVEVKNEEVYVSEIPFMTEKSSFVVNGHERVVVSQLHRSPGIYFEHDDGKNHVSNKLIYTAKIIPYYGNWLDIEFDAKDLIYFRIDKRRKMSVTILLKALGYTRDNILDFFYDHEEYNIKRGKIYKTIDLKTIKGEIATGDIFVPKTDKLIIAKGKKILVKHIKEIEQAKIKEIEVDTQDLEGKILAADVYNDDRELILQANTIIDENSVSSMLKNDIYTFKTLYVNDIECGSYLADTLRAEESSKENANTQEEAVHIIYNMLRPGEPYSVDIATTTFKRTFFSPEYYDLSEVGRFKFNSRTYNYDFDPRTSNWFKKLLTTVKRNQKATQTILSPADILITVAILVELRNGHNFVDDIDHLGNRRIRSVGELIENQFRIGLVRIEKTIKEKFAQHLEEKDLVISKLLSAKPISSNLKDFFATSQLSQFMDQTNPLAEVTHKRRISALGPGGLTRERAGFEVRDVHVTHYGRLCPIETPEGQNIGLINSLAIHARANNLGFLETPYRKVINGTITNEIEYMSAIEEEKAVVAYANTAVDKSGKLLDDMAYARVKCETSFIPAEQVTHMDISTNQAVSVAATLIPFLEHDDANRALMGSNMQRQGVPCLRVRAPLIGTGMERKVAIDSCAVVTAKRSGVVIRADSARIVIKADISNDDDNEVGIDIYNLLKYKRSNQNTCINQKSIVKVGDYIQIGDIIADGMSTDLGELAVGQNVMVAFMPWNGYNFEDSILVSERLVAEDVYTSIHIEELVAYARETKIGDEEITADIPNVPQSQLARLDASGVIMVGSEVTAGDIIVGKITPKGETQLTPEEKLLRAIFGEKASDVKDTSLRAPLGMHGVVIDVHVFERDEADRHEIQKRDIEYRLEKIREDLDYQLSIIENDYKEKLSQVLIGCLVNGEKTPLDKKLIAKYKDIYALLELKMKDSAIVEKQNQIKKHLNNKKQEFDKRYAAQKVTLSESIELPNDVIKMVKIYVAVKRRLQPGDKMAGRHGNKGVVSKIMPVEDMPFRDDGVPVDVVLNALGVPSRMNIGQVFEVHLGLASFGLGQKVAEMLATKTDIQEIRKFLDKIYNFVGKPEDISSLSDLELLELASNLVKGVPFATPVFDGAKEDEIKAMLELAGFDQSGQVRLRDGRTGAYFDRPVTIGIMYVLKLHHLIEEKVHARSTGSYSVITQQPLGGKSQFGGQRFGEMEVWALEAYGAAYILSELLTVKSDSVEGRADTYINILKGNLAYGKPRASEAFRVLIRELKALALDIKLLDDLPESLKRKAVNAVKAKLPDNVQAELADNLKGIENV
jgi:DNA-directed RNA polymerase subunit beta